MYLNGKIDRQFVKCGKIAKNAIKDALKNRDSALCFADNNLNQVQSQRFDEKPKQNKPSNRKLIEETSQGKSTNQHNHINRPEKNKTRLPREILKTKYVEWKKDFIEKNPGSYIDEIICLRKMLPANPNDFEKLGWIDVTHPQARINSPFSRNFYHPQYGIELRFDRAQPNMPGFRGMDHYQIFNPISAHEDVLYLSLHGEMLKKYDTKSHILVSRLKNKCNCE